MTADTAKHDVDAPQAHCPCCGAVIPKPVDFPRVLDDCGLFATRVGTFRLAGQPANMLTLLLRRFPAIVSLNEICAALWRDGPEPTSSLNILQVRFTQLRKVLVNSGYTIKSTKRLGACLIATSDPR